MTDRSYFVLQAHDMGRLIAALGRHGYAVYGPILRDGAIVYDRISSAEELPSGWASEQEPGHYRLNRREDDAVFGYTLGAESWKKFLYPAQVRLLAAERKDDTFRILGNNTQIADNASRPRAFLGVRPCELQAIAVQDRVFLGGEYTDPLYAKCRSELFIVVAQCTRPVATCFCASMQTGPRALAGFDLAVTELVEPDSRRFLVESGSARGAELLSELPVKPATEEDVQAATAAIEAAGQQLRRIDTKNIKELLYQNAEHRRWDDVARRCLTCGNCTMVCPTCFCSSVDDVSDISGDRAERWRSWDSCFTLSFSYIHGGSIRNSNKGRYRQWITHKLAAWIDQFGCSGCVGCGRCITWCPVGIDITEEIRAIREGQDHGKP